MEALEFLLVIAAFAAVLVWYLRNEEAGADGLLGMLALRDDPDVSKTNRRRSYRIIPRVAQRAHQRRLDAVLPAASDGEHMRRRYRHQDEARYRVMDKASRYKNTGDAGAA